MARNATPRVQPLRFIDHSISPLLHRCRQPFTGLASERGLTGRRQWSGNGYNCDAGECFSGADGRNVHVLAEIIPAPCAAREPRTPAWATRAPASYARALNELCTPPDKSRNGRAALQPRVRVSSRVFPAVARRV